MNNEESLECLAKNKQDRVEAIKKIFSKLSIALAGGNLEDYTAPEIYELLKPFENEVINKT